MACKKAKVRLKWGCDADTKDPIYAIDCWACDGHDPKCRLCEMGKVMMYKCPTRCATPEVIAVIKAYNWMKSGFLPVDGGIQSQSRTFLSACEFIAGRHAHYEAKESDAAKTKHRK